MALPICNQCLVCNLRSSQLTEPPMKRILIVLSLALGAIWGCSEAYDDTEIKNMIEDLEGRTAALEDLCARVNTGIMLVSRLEEACQLKVKVKDVAENKDDAGRTVSYTVTLTDGSVLTITCPTDGKDGYVGKPGADASAPEISTGEHGGVLCWMIGGEFAKDGNGNPVPLYTYASGTQTKGRTPVLKVEGEQWFYRFSETEDWTPVRMVYGDGNVFSSVTDNGDEVIFELSAGGSMALAKVSVFSLSLGISTAEVAPGKSFEFTYTVEPADLETTVEAFVPAKWKAVAADGKVTVVVPADAEAGTKADIVVFATKETGESVYRIINVTVTAAS